MNRARRGKILAKADDAIPAGAIRLTEAFSLVKRAFLNVYPDFPISDDPFVLGLLEMNRDRERQRLKHRGDGGDGQIFSIDCNVFFRERLRAGELNAYVRDPQSGEILRLRTVGWIPDQWLMPDGFIQAGIDSDHIHPDDPNTPGPDGALLRGALRPVFFYFDEFEKWLEHTFQEGSSNRARVAAPAVSAHRRSAVKQAIVALWGDVGPGPGVSERLRERKINQWLKSNDLATVSDATIRRALRELRVTANDRT